MTEKKRKYTDRYLEMLWRKAVLAEFKNRCAYCGNLNIDEIECHHIVKRRHKILRWDWKNGVTGCKHTCHKFYHTVKGGWWIATKHIYYSYLLEMEGQYKQYLVENGFTDTDFRRIKVSELKNKIKEHENEL